MGPGTWRDVSGNECTKTGAISPISPMHPDFPLFHCVLARILQSGYHDLPKLQVKKKVMAESLKGWPKVPQLARLRGV
jgi:hypothetical protein